jgi:hypothetical protein
MQRLKLRIPRDVERVRVEVSLGGSWKDDGKLGRYVE